MPFAAPLHLAVALDGAGWHPAAWREKDARPRELFSASYWTGLAQEAERGLLDFVTLEDSLAVQSVRRGMLDDRTDQVRGRLDAVLVAARIAPKTSAVGLIPVITTTHTEPFHISKAIATLDFVSQGRAGLQAQVSATSLEARQFGRRPILDLFPNDVDAIGGGHAISNLDLIDEAADFIEVVRLLWDSWEDDAEVRNVATGRFIDRDKLHYIDFVGTHFSVKGPSITPRPPQGHPLVTALARGPATFELAALCADVVFITPRDTATVRSLIDIVRAHEEAVHRSALPQQIFADILVFLDDDGAQAQRRRERLDDLDEHPLLSDALIFAGTPHDLTELMVEWHRDGISGFRLRPGTLPHDLQMITRSLVPALQHRSLFRQRYDDVTLRSRLGLSRPANRYATA